MQVLREFEFVVFFACTQANANTVHSACYSVSTRCVCVLLVDFVLGAMFLHVLCTVWDFVDFADVCVVAAR